VPGIEAEGFRIVLIRATSAATGHTFIIKDREKCKIVLDATLEPYDIRMSRQNVRRVETAAKN
jgi:hypothetical protein